MTFALAACAEMLWRDRPMVERLKRLTELGFQAEFWNWKNHDVAAMAASGATFSVMNGALEGQLGDDAGAEAMLASAKDCVEIAKRLNCPRLCVLGSVLGDRGRSLYPCPNPTGAMWLKARDTLNRLADLGEANGVTFILENLNAAVDHPGVPFARAEDTLALVSSVNRPGMRLNLDLYHLQIGEGNLIETCRKSLPFIGEIQVADVPGRTEPGTGEINYRAVALALKDMGYRGTIGMEALASDNPEVALQRFRAIFTL